MAECGKFFNYDKLLRCIPHVSSDDFKLEVKTSTIPKAGNGLFVKPGFRMEPEELIIEYRGVIVPAHLLTEKPTTEMNWDENGEYSLLGENIAAFINDIIDFRPFSEEELYNYINFDEYPTHEGKDYNCQFVKIGNRIFSEATRPIEGGEELFTSYGRDYWLYRMMENGWISPDVFMTGANY